MSKKIEIGDWVRFYNCNGKLVVGVVEYLLDSPKTACTGEGSVFEDDILEVRKAISAPEEIEDVLSPEAQAARLKKFGHIPVDDLEISVRSCNVLFNTGHHTVANIMENPKSHYRKLKGFGSKSVNELVDTLWYRFGLRLPECTNGNS